MKKYYQLILKLLISLILLQTLFFKFSGAQESIDLFTMLAGHYEVGLRIGTGVLELIASALLFIPKKTWLGALLTFSTMSGAIMSHILILGIEHNNDHGLLFISAIITFLASGNLLFLNRKSIPIIGNRY